MPQGGMAVQNNNIGSVKLAHLTFDDAIFVPVIAAITTIVSGTILGRVTASGKLTPFTTGATHGAGSDVPVGVLGTDVVSDATPSDENIQYIVEGHVREELLVVDAGDPGDLGATLDLQEILKDQLRNVGIVPLFATDFSSLDNQ